MSASVCGVAQSRTDLPEPGHPGGACTRRPNASDTACRCSDECVQIGRAAKRIRDSRRRAGHSSRVPAQQVQGRIQDFLWVLPDSTLADLADAAGVSTRTLVLVRSAPEGRTVNLDTAVKVGMAVDRRIGRHVSGVGARRRVEALISQGWSSAAQARHVGCAPEALSYASLVPTASARVVEAVDRTFQMLRYRSGPSEALQREATRVGYLPWPCWSGFLDRPAMSPLLEDQDATRVSAYHARTAPLHFPLAAGTGSVAS